MRKTSVARIASGESRKIGAAGTSPRFHQVDQVDDELLGTLHRERRNQQRALAGGGVADLRGEPRAAGIRRGGRTLPISIGRFRDDVVKACRRLGIRLQQFAVRADVAGRKDTERFLGCVVIGTFDLDRGGAEQMPGVPIARANPRNDVDPFFVVGWREELQRGERIGLRINRSDLGAPARGVAPVERGDLGLLDAAGVRQHVGAEIDGAAGRKDAAGKSVAYQFGQQAAVVDMGVG